MDVKADALVAWVAGSFPEHRWNAEGVRFGAFHHIAPSDQFVARVVHGKHQAARAAREARLLWTLREVHLSVAMPRLCSDVFSSPGRTAYLTTLVPGGPGPVQAWPELRDSHLTVLDSLAAVRADDLDLPPVRSWCGGAGFPAIVDEQLCPRLPAEVAEVARQRVAELLALPASRSRTFVHGDFGQHNLLWQESRAIGLIDFDHACVDDPAIDLAPLIGQYGTRALSSDFSGEQLSRAMVHRATLSLQVAAAAEIYGLPDLRDHALGNFVRRQTEGTLHDPYGARP